MPRRMALNCSATQLAVLDASGALSFYDPTARCHHSATREVTPMHWMQVQPFHFPFPKYKTCSQAMAGINAQ